MNIRETAKWLSDKMEVSRSPRTIERWVARNKIPHVRLNGRIEFRKGELISWLENKSAKAS